MDTRRSIGLFGTSWRIFSPRHELVVAGFPRTAWNGARLVPISGLATRLVVINCRSRSSGSGAATFIFVRIVAAISAAPGRCAALLRVSPVAARLMAADTIPGFG
jgi:hypothetical protein